MFKRIIKFNRILFIVLLFICKFSFGASLPSASFASNYSDDEFAYTNNSNGQNPANGFYNITCDGPAEIKPLLKGPPDLPPDPGAPIDGWVPFAVMTIGYSLYVFRRKKIIAHY